VSAEQEERIRAGVAAFSRGDVEAMLENHAPDVEYRTAITTVEGGIYRGHEGVRQWLAELSEVVEDLDGHVDEIHEIDENRYLAAGRFRGRGKESGAQFDMEMAWVYRFREGQLIRYEAYFDRAEALSSLELAEWPSV
jgi:ketosteroid isomerase-like protein